MFDLIVLGLVVAGLTAIARVPAPKRPAQPAPTPWATQIDWTRFHKPTYLRRGIVLDGGRARFTPPGKRRSPYGKEAQPSVTGDTP